MKTKKLVIKSERCKPLFKDKDLIKESPISTKELDKHLRKRKKIDNLISDMVQDLDWDTLGA